MKTILFAAASFCLAVSLAYAAPPGVGDPAPQFEAASTAGPIALKDFQGKKAVIIAFYYADFTSA